MNKKLFNTEELDSTDKILTMSYLIVHAFILFGYIFDFINRDIIKQYYFIIGIISFFLVFDIFNKSFRKYRMLIIWGIIAIIQLIIYLKIRNRIDFQAVNGTYLSWLKALPLTLFLMVAFNLINLRTFGDFFISTIIRLKPNELIENRQLRPADYLFTYIGFVLVILISSL